MIEIRSKLVADVVVKLAVMLGQQRSDPVVARLIDLCRVFPVRLRPDQFSKPALKGPRLDDIHHDHGDGSPHRSIWPVSEAAIAWAPASPIELWLMLSVVRAGSDLSCETTQAVSRFRMPNAAKDLTVRRAVICYRRFDATLYLLPGAARFARKQSFRWITAASHAAKYSRPANLQEVGRAMRGPGDGQSEHAIGMGKDRWLKRVWRFGRVSGRMYHCKPAMKGSHLPNPGRIAFGKFLASG
jgi:hypothetical protein